jgi:single-strand DNA-binding protein
VVENTYFFDCDCIGRNATTINKFLRKGREILVTGSLKQDKWKDKESGDNRSRIVIQVEDFEFLDSPKDTNSNDDSKDNKSTQSANDEDNSQQQKPTTRKKNPF